MKAHGYQMDNIETMEGLLFKFSFLVAFKGRIFLTSF